MSLADPKLLHLAARGAWEVVGFVQFLRPFLARHPRRLEVRADLVERGHRRAGPQAQHRRGPFPERSSGAATTTASTTAGMPSSTSSTSSALMFSPPRMMTSDMRSVMVRYPSSSSTPTSPVRYQPSSSNARAVSSSSV